MRFSRPSYNELEMRRYPLLSRARSLGEELYARQNAAAKALGGKENLVDSDGQDDSSEEGHLYVKAVDDVKAFNAAGRGLSSNQEAQQLKNLIYAILRPQGREFDNMIRSLRYLANIEQLQILSWQSSLANLPVQCSKHITAKPAKLGRHGEVKIPAEPEEVCPGVSDYHKLRIISLCGHVACLDCLNNRRFRNTCVVEACKGTISDIFLQEIDRFGVKDSTRSSSNFTGFDAIEDQIVSPMNVTVGKHPFLRSDIRKAILNESLTYEDIKKCQPSGAKTTIRAASKAANKRAVRENDSTKHPDFEGPKIDLTIKYGAKLDAVVKILKTNSYDKAILFVQMDSMMKQVKDCFDNNKILAHCIPSSGKSFQQDQVNKIADFKDKNGTAQVLVLDLTSEHAAGLNLTEANHVIFLSPLLVTNQQRYDATMLQAIRRAHRFGQTKTVHVYRFAALNTIDVNILQHRERWLSEPLLEYRIAVEGHKTSADDGERQARSEKIGTNAVIKHPEKPRRARLVQHDNQYKLVPIDFVISEGLQAQRDHGSLIDLDSMQPEEFFFDD